MDANWGEEIEGGGGFNLGGQSTVKRAMTMWGWDPGGGGGGHLGLNGLSILKVKGVDGKFSFHN